MQGKALRALAGVAATLSLVACASRDPLAEKPIRSPAKSPERGPRVSATSEAQLRRLVENAAARELAEADKLGESRVITRTEQVSKLGIPKGTMPELEGMAGPNSYSTTPTVLGEDLTGRPARSVAMSLERAIQTAVKNNIAVQFARLSPAIGEAQVVAAEAAFDWTLFSNTTWNNTDSPRVQTGFGAAPSGPTANLQNAVANSIGLRRTLLGGGRLTVQQELNYTDDRAPGQTVRPNPASGVAYTLQYDQPLLRGSGSEVTQAEVRIARNAERNNVQTLKRDLLRVTADAERTYWQLVQARQDLLILQRLLDRGEKVRDQLITRAQAVGDTNRAQIADATARVARRRTDVTRAQTNLKTLSDRLKLLMNDPELPVGSEIVILPLDKAVDEPIKFSLADSMRAAVLYRPEIQQSIIGIDDASIRRIVADNAREPDLSIRLQARLSELQDSFGDSYKELVETNFVDYVVGLAFEQPIGNRRAESDFRRRSLERMQSVIAYRNTVQQVTQEVKSAIDRVVLNYKLIEQTRASRVAASEVLRVLQVEKNVTQGITPERLDLELNREEALAAAEREETQALTEYNIAITDLFAAMGTLLERSNIRFAVPAAEDEAWFQKQETASEPKR